MGSRRNGRCKGLLVYIILFGVILSGKGDAKLLLVGKEDNSSVFGWDSSPTHHYSIWASAQTIEVGDALIFTYDTGKHDVQSFPLQASYDACDFSTATLLGYSSENFYVWTAPAPGVYFFGCSYTSAGGVSDCELGQKFSLTVVSRAVGAVNCIVTFLPHAIYHLQVGQNLTIIVTTINETTGQIVIPTSSIHGYLQFELTPNIMSEGDVIKLGSGIPEGTPWPWLFFFDEYGNGTYIANIQLKSAGPLYMNISYFGDSIPGSPFQLYVEGGALRYRLDDIDDGIILKNWKYVT